MAWKLMAIHNFVELSKSIQPRPPSTCELPTDKHCPLTPQVAMLINHTHGSHGKTVCFWWP